MTATSPTRAERPLTSLLDVVRAGASAMGRPPTYRFREGAGDTPTVVTGAQLEHVARAIAGQLQVHHDRGERILLLLPPGRPFLLGFFGAVASGLVPVPAPALSRVRVTRGLDAARRVADDSGAVAVLTTASLAAAMRAARPVTEVLGHLRWHAIDELVRGDASRWTDPSLTGEDTAFIQYTSGSTAAPRGVVVTQAAVLANLRTIHDAFRLDEPTRVVMWLPPHHDMGLIGGLLTPLHSRYDTLVMAPTDFAQAPWRWLRAISDERATISGGPDFAYRLCAERIRDEHLEGLDLSSWRLAFTGAEPVSASTIDSFCERFGPYGFRREAFYPCYGLAESTLIVTGGTSGVAPRTRSVSRRALLEAGQVQPPESTHDERRLVSCGRPVGEGTEVVIVDPEAGTERPAGVVGEIWVRGPSVAGGYHNRPDATAGAFGAHLPDGRGPYLRSGDLGVLIDGELHVTGRLKDIVIVQGRTLDAHDVETAVRQSVPGDPQGMTAALSTADDGHERFVLAHEVGRRLERPPDEVVQEVQAAIAARFDVRADEVVLLRIGALPRTTSGKLRRSEAARMLVEGELAGLR